MKLLQLLKENQLGNNYTGDLTPLLSIGAKNIVVGTKISGSRDPRHVQFELNPNWICNATIYDEPSKNGINNGRVSKLWINDKEKGFYIYEYDRGLNRKTPIGLKLADRIANCLK
jgi:hypothetical protein